MAQLKQTYLAKDGKEFKTSIEADGHDRAVEMKGKIDEYCKAVGIKLDKSQAGFLRKHLPGFAVFMESGVVLEESKETGAESAEPAAA